MRFEELSSHEIAALDRDRTVLILPLGSVEQHGRHMPLGTDTMLAHAVALAAEESVPGVAVLPPPWYGFSAHHMRFPGSITLRAETLIALCEDIVGSSSPTASAASSSSMATAAMRPSSTCSRPRSATCTTAGPDRHAHLFHAGARGDRAAPPVRARRHGPCLRVRDRDDAAPPAGAGKMERAATTYPDPGSPYLTTDLIGAHGRTRLPRLRRPFADRHARRSVARDRPTRRRLLRSLGRGARRLHRGLPHMAHPGEPVRLRSG